ncbi:hypothetical protein TOPH_03842 [Tolypocladium ophioglossoides CBS 100239]|uniref:Nucleotide-diphospho-sugar transferase domain-containing protein n=1 Tax=Tolypocladium ophioglossoides (strain CBS 100239) TaxID=1163406 RepID=A0A0L0NBU6_TOLOC|nr:hypothetical protein TOPH_03842 [Tolypocladium ophioglossoides CBS 100239]
MVLAGAVRSTKGTVLVVGAVFFVVAFIGLIFNHLNSWDQPTRTNPESDGFSAPPANVVPGGAITPSTSNAPAPPPPPFGESAAALRNFYLKQLRKPSVKPDDERYHPWGAFNWSLPDNPRWKQRMGESLCIIDLDNRPFNESQQIFGPDAMTWDNALAVHGLSLGVLNHWIYAKIHGYKYYYVATEHYGDRRASWKKPPIMTKILKEHDVCLYIDSDAIFHRLDLPFEWLLNYWELYPESNSLALAFDPDNDWNKDRFGKVYLNTGFIVAQNNPTTYKILDTWQRCPDEGEPYPTCTEFRLNFPGQPTDQGGFGTFVRYNFSESIRELPCTEANGYPESDSGCKGQFIRHLWTGKHDQIKVDVGEQVPGPYLQMFHEQFKDEMDTFYMTERDLMSKGPKAATKKRPATKARKESGNGKSP